MEAPPPLTLMLGIDTKAGYAVSLHQYYKSWPSDLRPTAMHESKDQIQTQLTKLPAIGRSRF